VYGVLDDGQNYIDEEKMKKMHPGAMFDVGKRRENFVRIGRKHHFVRIGKKSAVAAGETETPDESDLERVNRKVHFVRIGR